MYEKTEGIVLRETEYKDNDRLLTILTRENGQVTARKADLRAFVLYGKEITVWQSGLTRYACEAGSYVVNSSQGGGFKDTWVLSR